MPVEAIAAFYIALNMLLAPILMYRVGQIRIGKDIHLGDGGNDLLLSRIRAHGNFTENAPLALLGLLAIAFLDGHPIAIHIFGGSFFIGRILHAMGMSGKFGHGRLIGTLATLLGYFGQAFYILYLILTLNTI